MVREVGRSDAPTDGKKHVYLLNMSTLMLRASCLTLEINDLDVMERKLAAARSRTQDTSVEDCDGW